MVYRRQLPNRRYQETFDFEVAGQKFVASVGYDQKTHEPMELFLNSNKMGSTSDANACDAAVAVSISLQYGVPLQVLSDAMKRNQDGTPQGPLGKALDMILGKK